jgi:hypothetical protein
MCNKKSLFAVSLIVLFLAFLYPQIGRADCPDDWWCPVDPPNPELVTNPFDPTGYSPGFDLIVCYDQPCASKLGPLPAGLEAPHVTINSSLGCTTGTTVALQGPAICAASTDGVVDPNSVAQCQVSVNLPNVQCTTAKNLATYSKFQEAQQDPSQVFTPDSKITINVPPPPAVGPTGWPCPTHDATGHCTADFFFPIGTQFCSSFNGCVAKIYPSTGTGIRSLLSGQVLKGLQSDNYTALRGCKGAVNGLPDSVTCMDKGTILTGGGEASVSVKCPEGSWSGTTQGEISPTSSNNGFDLFGSAVCPLKGIVQSSVELNGVPNQGCQQPPGSKHIRCFFDENAVYTASGCTPNKVIELIATGDINVPQGTGTVTVPFFTNPGQPVTCK